MILIVKTSLGRELELDTDTLPIQGRAGVGVQLKRRCKLKDGEFIISMEEK